MSEGNRGVPLRHPIQWRDAKFYDPDKLDLEERRVFDVCHTCRRCFNLCESFPRLFDMIDESDSMELDSVYSEEFGKVVDACTLCDMCFNKCPYIPPHEFDIDFPHLMLRHRAVQHRQNQPPLAERAMTETDRNGRMARPVAGLANWATRTGNHATRPLIEKMAHVHREAALPKFNRRTLVGRSKKETPAVDESAPAHGRKAVIYATCFGNYNDPQIGVAARAVLARNGVETKVLHPRCCGMPQLEQGDLERVAEHARSVAAEFKPWIEDGYKIVALVPSCALMIKQEWPLLLPEDEDIKRLKNATFDLTEYVVDIASKEGLADGLEPLDGGVSVHLACHARAQYVGNKAVDMLRLIPGADLDVIERCSGHGGSWGVKKDNFEIALKIGKPVARQVARSGKKHLVSECPLAGEHIAQGVERLNGETPVTPPRPRHPIELLAQAYGLETEA